MKRRRRRRLTGDVAVVVGAVVVLQERDQSVQEVVWTQQDEFLQHVCRNQNRERKTDRDSDTRHANLRVGKCALPRQALRSSGGL